MSGKVWWFDVETCTLQFVNKKTPQLINTRQYQSSNSHGAKSDGLAARHARPNLATRRVWNSESHLTLNICNICQEPIPLYACQLSKNHFKVCRHRDSESHLILNISVGHPALGECTAVFGYHKVRQFFIWSGGLVMICCMVIISNNIKRTLSLILLAHDWYFQ